MKTLAEIHAGIAKATLSPTVGDCFGKPTVAEVQIAIAGAVMEAMNRPAPSEKERRVMVALAIDQVQADVREGPAPARSQSHL